MESTMSKFDEVLFHIRMLILEEMQAESSIFRYQPDPGYVQ